MCLTNISASYSKNAYSNVIKGYRKIVELTRLELIASAEPSRSGNAWRNCKELLRN